MRSTSSGRKERIMVGSLHVQSPDGKRKPRRPGGVGGFFRVTGCYPKQTSRTNAAGRRGCCVTLQVRWEAMAIP